MLETMMLGGKKRMPPPSKFNGEIVSEAFVTAINLSNALGLATGQIMNNSTPWLMFTYKGKELYVPKLPLRHSLGWQHIYAVGAVYGSDDTGIYPVTSAARVQNQRVNINGKTYKVRLLKGATTNPIATDIPDGYDQEFTYGSEWNDLFYPISNDPSALSYDGPRITNPYSPSDLGFGNAEVLISACSITQEVGGGSSPLALTRGGFQGGHANSVSHNRYSQVSSGAGGFGWRPCLELVP